MGCGASTTADSVKPIGEGTLKRSAVPEPAPAPLPSGEITKIFDVAAIDSREKVKYNMALYDLSTANNTTYQDKEFPAEKGSLSSNPEAFLSHLKVEGGCQWLRADEIFKTSDFKVYYTVDPTDIIQGLISDCYLLSALSVLAEKPQFLKRIFVSSDVNKNGCYCVWLNVDGEWRSFVIDDKFPCDAVGKPLFASSDSKELWVPLIEKAYAKHFGGYSKIEMGFGSNAMRDLTGAPTYTFLSTTGNPEDDPNKCWNMMTEYFAQGFVITATSAANDKGPNVNKRKGLVSAHVYAVLALKEVQDSKGKLTKIVKMRNPWAQFEWKGDWSDNSDKWTKEAKDLVGFEKKDDGIFWISYPDFLKEFTIFEVCCIHPNYTYQSLKIIPDDPKRTLFMVKAKVKKAGYYYLSVDQKDARHFEGDNYDYGFVSILLVQEQGTSVPHKKNIVYRSGATGIDRNVVLEGELEVGEYYALIHMVWPSGSFPFVLSSYGPNVIDYGYVSENEETTLNMVKAALFDAALKSNDIKHSDLAEYKFPMIKKHEGIIAGYVIFAYENPLERSLYTQTIQFTNISGLRYYGEWDAANTIEVSVPGSNREIYFLKIVEPNNWNYEYTGEFKVYEDQNPQKSTQAGTSIHS